MDTIYAIFDDFGDCIYLCYSYADEENEYYEQVEEMNDWDWECHLTN